MHMNSQRGLRALAVGTLAVALLSGCSSVKNLFSSKSKDKTGEPTELVDITPSVSVKALWTATVGKGEDTLGIGQHPVVVDGRVFAAAVEGGVSALDLQTGQQAWRYDSKLALSGGPGAGEGLVVVGSLEGDVIALDAADGHEKWKAKLNNEILSAPVVSGGMVFVHSNDGRLTAFDAASGERRWFYAGDMPALTVRGNASVTMGPGIVFLAGDNGSVTALNAQNGNVMWSTPVAEPDGRSELERMVDVDAAPALEGTALFASSYKNHTVAIDGPSGQVLWESDRGGARGVGLSNSAVVITDRDGNVVGLDKNTGGSLWQQDGLRNRKVTAPAVQGDYAVVGDYKGVLHWIRLNDGAFAARSKLGDAVSGRPVVSGEIVVVQSSDGKLAAYALQ